MWWSPVLQTVAVYEGVLSEIVFVYFLTLQIVTKAASDQVQISIRGRDWFMEFRNFESYVQLNLRKINLRTFQIKVL